MKSMSITAVSIMALSLVLLGYSSGHASSADWIQYIQSGKPFQAVLDKTADKFNDAAYSGSSETDPMGNLKGGETYTVEYQNGAFACTGYNQAYGRVGTWTYSNADPADNLISLWGRPLAFDGQGRLFDPEYGLVGHLRKGRQTGNTTSAPCVLSVSGALDDHYKSTGQYNIAVTANGIGVVGAQPAPFEHGRPYGAQFENWKTLQVNLGALQSGQQLDVGVTHSGSPSSDWIGIDYLALTCGGKTHKTELQEYPNYGAQDGAAAIVYGGQTKTWTITAP